MLSFANSLAMLLILTVSGYQPGGTSAQYTGENFYLKEIKQLSPDVGELKTGCISPDSLWICWQGNCADGCMGDQIWIMPIIGGTQRMISPAVGEAVKPVFTPDGKRVVYSMSTGPEPEKINPAEPASSLHWRLDDLDIYITDLGGVHQTQLTNVPGFDGEAAVSPDGKTVAFTSVRDGDVDIFTMTIDGLAATRLTDTFGYDCLPRFSPDGEWILFSSYTPRTDAEIEHYGEMIAAGKAAPPWLELDIMRADGSERRRITNLKAISISPCMHPHKKVIVFSSNYNQSPLSGKGGIENFDLFMIGLDGTGLRQVTFDPKFDGEPSFSGNGSKLTWISGRGSASTGGRSIYSAIWTGGKTVPAPAPEPTTGN